MKVIDSSSLAKYVNHEENWDKVSEVLREGCISIELIVKEVGNSLWKRVMSKELTADRATAIFRGFIARNPLKLTSQEVLYETAFSLSTRRRMTLYDALFVELAKRLGVTLVTSDSRQAEACREEGVEVAYVP